MKKTLISHIYRLAFLYAIIKSASILQAQGSQSGYL